MKAKINISINVPDDLKCGDCINCPLRAEKWIDDLYTARNEVSCKLEYNEVTCPIDVLENKSGQ